MADARQETDSLAKLLPGIAGHWEHATLLMRGLVAEAVHRTDSFELTRGVRADGRGSSIYEALGGLFQAALPAVFPERVRSEVCGRAIGTRLQCEIYRGLLERAPTGSPVPASAERAGDRRILRRHRQGAPISVPLPIGDGRWCLRRARHWLALSLRLDNDGHPTLAAAIQDLGESPSIDQGFAQIHWFRLGVTALLDGAEDEGSAFLTAVREARALSWPWSLGERGDEYPAHGILRRVAVIHAAAGEVGRVNETLRRLTRILAVAQGKRVPLAIIRLAAARRGRDHAMDRPIEVGPSAARLQCGSARSSPTVGCAANPDRGDVPSAMERLASYGRPWFVAYWTQIRRLGRTYSNWLGRSVTEGSRSMRLAGGRIGLRHAPASRVRRPRGRPGAGHPLRERKAVWVARKAVASEPCQVEMSA